MAATAAPPAPSAVPVAAPPQPPSPTRIAAFARPQSATAHRIFPSRTTSPTVSAPPIPKPAGTVSAASLPPPPPPPVDGSPPRSIAASASSGSLIVAPGSMAGARHGTVLASPTTVQKSAKGLFTGARNAVGVGAIPVVGAGTAP
ncbi:unnamed protein product [Sphacelaria rigidula]